MILVDPKINKPMKKTRSEKSTNRATKITTIVKSKFRFSRIFKMLKATIVKIVYS